MLMRPLNIFSFMWSCEPEILNVTDVGGYLTLKMCIFVQSQCKPPQKKTRNRESYHDTWQEATIELP